MSASTHSPVLKHHFGDLGQQHASERLGMWMFLATEVLFFAGLFGAYACYRYWYASEFEFASAFMNLKIASINTVLLVTSSLTMTLAIRAAKLGNKGGLYTHLLLTFALGAGFMALKGVEYAHDFHESYLPGESTFVHSHMQTEAAERGLDTGKVRLFLCFYYIMTGIHGIHIVIGLGCILWLVQQTYANKIPPENYSTVEVVSLYWHLVDAIWLFLMPLLYLAGAHLKVGPH